MSMYVEFKCTVEVFTKERSSSELAGPGEQEVYGKEFFWQKTAKVVSRAKKFIKICNIWPLLPILCPLDKCWEIRNKTKINSKALKTLDKCPRNQKFERLKAHSLICYEKIKQKAILSMLVYHNGSVAAFGSRDSGLNLSRFVVIKYNLIFVQNIMYCKAYDWSDNQL